MFKPTNYGTLLWQINEHRSAQALKIPFMTFDC